MLLYFVMGISHLLFSLLICTLYLSLQNDNEKLGVKESSEFLELFIVLKQRDPLRQYPPTQSKQPAKRHLDTNSATKNEVKAHSCHKKFHPEKKGKAEAASGATEYLQSYDLVFPLPSHGRNQTMPLSYLPLWLQENGKPENPINAVHVARAAPFSPLNTVTSEQQTTLTL